MTHKILDWFAAMNSIKQHVHSLQIIAATKSILYPKNSFTHFARNRWSSYCTIAASSVLYPNENNIYY